jgi:hypothetical protein
LRLLFRVVATGLREQRAGDESRVCCGRGGDDALL